MNKRLLSIFLFLKICLPDCVSQTEQDSFYLKKTSAFEREMTHVAYDSTADAVILLDKMNIEVDAVNYSNRGWLVAYNQYRKVKILKKSGIQTWATFKDFVANYEDLNFEATVYSPTGQATVLGVKDLFVEQLNEFTRVVKASFPGIEVGSIIEIKTRITSPNKFRLKTWFFQNEVPTIRSIVNLTIPHYYNYAVITKGLEQNQIVTEAPTGGGAYKYSTNSMNPMLPESFTTTVDDYRASITFQLNEYIAPAGNSYKQLENWDAFSKMLWGKEDFGSFFFPKNSKKTWAIIEDLLGKDFTCEQKMAAIYDWVNSQIIWNGQYEIRNRTGIIDDIYKKRSGNSTEVNALLLVLLKRAGINADPVFLSTRSNGYAIQDYPVIDQFNHFIIKAECAGKDVFLDAGNRFRPVNILPFDAMNEVGMFVPQVGTAKWIKLPVEKTVRAYEIKAKFEKNAEFSGQAKITTIGQLATNDREAITLRADTTSLDKVLSKTNPGISLHKKIFLGKENPNEPFIKTFDFVAIQQSNGDLLYFNPVLDASFSENPFKDKERKSPVDFGIQMRETYRLDVDLPEGYKIESAPADFSISLLKDAAGFDYKSTVSGRKVRIAIDFRTVRVIYPASEYREVQQFFDLVSQKYAEQFVLKKE